MTPPPPLTLEPLPPSDPLPAPLTFLPFLSASVLWGHTYDVYRIFGNPDFLPALPAFGPDLWYKVTYHVRDLGGVDLFFMVPSADKSLTRYLVYLTPPRSVM